ncbi:MAG: TIGR00341 family protein [Candidatus Jordarchaeales archaeon]
MVLRALHVIVPRDRADEILNMLGEAGWVHSYVSGVDNTFIIIEAGVREIEEVMEHLKAIGVGREYGSIYLMSPLTSLPQPRKRKELLLERASKDEILSVIERSGKLSGNYLVLILLSAILAALGLLANNVIVVIGSTLVSPLMGPITTTAIGTVMSDRQLFKDGVKAELVGIGLSVLIGFLLTKMFPGASPTTEILSVAQLTLAEFVLAIISGLAAAVCLTGGIEAALVGVAIAASLLPPAANVGIGLGLGNPAILFGSVFLLLINIFSINLACTLMFWVQGIRPLVTRRRMVAVRVIRRRAIAVFLALLALSIPVIITTQGIYAQTQVTPAATLATYSQAWSAKAVVSSLNVIYERNSNIAIVQATIYSDEPISSDIALKISAITTFASRIPTITIIHVIQVNSIILLLG